MEKMEMNSEAQAREAFEKWASKTIYANGNDLRFADFLAGRNSLSEVIEEMVVALEFYANESVYDYGCWAMADKAKQALAKATLVRGK